MNGRFLALKEVGRRRANSQPEYGKVSECFGADVFSAVRMRQYLSRDVFESVMASIERGEPIDRRIADQVAEGMKIWAVERGATHYTHWFQPLNGSTAEKHDAFISPSLTGHSFESFRGSELAQQEPDASSFPSGGLRNTFEARGYSAWDPSSPAFLLNGTLCIPSIFVAYTGEVLDTKTPLLKSIAAVDRAAVEVCRLFDRDVERVYPTLGCEQEYFLVDEALYNARPDLVQTGRTLMGHCAAKDQQLEDQYWGSIPERVSNFMKEYEAAAYRLGIPLQTRHNEVAPNQFECAPLFEEANIAVDHNVLLMNLMRIIAKRHNLVVLFHEKPFAGVNGSGKHCNWSLATAEGVNLLAPGKNPKGNMQFLSFFVAVLSAVNRHGTLLMASVASQSNSYRLGGNEAPPSIMSVFTGTTISNLLAAIETKISNSALTPDEKSVIKLDIGKIPDILLDNTDRNRTSPFAFTGNRFEFRAIGSSANPAVAVTTLNTIVAEALIQFKSDVDKLVGEGIKRDEAILKIIRSFAVGSKRIRFEGNGYSSEWIEEAGRRGLKGIGSVPEAFAEFTSGESVALFEKFGVLNRTELEARRDINDEIFLKRTRIESRVVGDMALNHIVPTAIKYENLLLSNAESIKAVLPGDFGALAGTTLRTIRKISTHIDTITALTAEMTEKRHKWNHSEEALSVRARGYESEIVPLMRAIRDEIDELEMVVDDRLWALPKYRELMAGL